MSDRATTVNAVHDLEADRKEFLAEALRGAQAAQPPGRPSVGFSDNMLFACMTFLSESGAWTQVSMTTAEMAAYHNQLGQMLARRGIR